MNAPPDVSDQRSAGGSPITAVFRKLIAHLGWADDAVVSALARAPLPEPAWLELLGHILGAEHVWLARLLQRDPTLSVWPTLTLEQCRTVAGANRRELEALIEQLRPEDFQRVVPYRNSAGLAFESTVEDILLHVCLHGSYHRGQIARAVRQGGATPAPTDYIGFIRGSPAATRQS